MWRQGIVILFVVLALWQRQPDAIATEADSISGPESFVYAKRDSLDLHAHIFRPVTVDTNAGLPVIIVFHGGGWVMGEASWSFPRAQRFAHRGIVSVAAQYRMSNQQDITPIEAMQDARDIVRWIRTNADSLGVDPNRIAAFGWSAGAHLAASAAIIRDSTDSTSGAAPNALILVSPALNLTGDAWVKTLLRNRASPEDISPAAHVRPGMPPTLVQVGETDTVTPLKGCRVFHDRMLAAGNQCELQVYPGVGHLFTPSHIPDDGWPQPDSTSLSLANARVDSFLVSIGFID